jgi:hypothetical protein
MRNENTYMVFKMLNVFQGNILKFDSIKKEHRGTYYCVATNVVGTGARRNIDVEVVWFLNQEPVWIKIYRNFKIEAFKELKTYRRNQIVITCRQNVKYTSIVQLFDF